MNSGPYEFFRSSSNSSGGWVGVIKNKDHRSPAEAENRTELGKILLNFKWL